MCLSSAIEVYDTLQPYLRQDDPGGPAQAVLPCSFSKELAGQGHVSPATRMTTG